MFFTQVQIRPTGQSVFTLDLRGPDGERIPTQPDEFAITNGLSVGKATLPTGFSLALADGSARSLAASGSTLPAKVQVRCHTSRELRAKTDDQLIISFLSGDESKADHNKVSTQILIKGTSLKRDLPRGTPLDLSVRINESGVPHPVVFIELLDEEFEPEHKGRMTSLEHEPAATMRERLAAVKRVIHDIREKSEGKLDSTITERLRKVDDPARLGRIDGMINAWASGDDVSAGKAAREIVDLT
jgi:molecular chaperone DnaK